jgi:hypothetical protein
MLLTKTSAIRQLRESTGRSIAFCEEQVNGMRSVRDGQRMKIHSRDLERIIRAENAPPEEVPEIRFSKRLRQRIEQEAI